jgi:hypothetical protein
MMPASKGGFGFLAGAWARVRRQGVVHGARRGLSPAAEEEDVIGYDFGHVALVPIPVVVAAGLQAAFDEYLLALVR